MEILLPPGAELNLEVDEEIIEKVAHEADGAEAPSQLDQEERGSILPRTRAKAPVQRLICQALSSEETFDVMRNLYLEQMYPGSPLEPLLLSE